MTIAARTRRRRAYRAGIHAERTAMLFLLCKGYRPVARRYKTPVGEIDLVVRRGRTLVFVEVKARAHRDLAAESIHATNRSRVVRAAQYYLQAQKNAAACNIRFDAVLIAWYSWPHHLPNAFSA